MYFTDNLKLFCFSDGRLVEGDQILAIDGQPLDSNISHEQAISILQKARGLVELVVARSTQGNLNSTFYSSLAFFDLILQSNFFYRQVCSMHSSFFFFFYKKWKFPFLKFWIKFYFTNLNCKKKKKIVISIFWDVPFVKIFSSRIFAWIIIFPSKISIKFFVR